MFNLNKFSHFVKGTEKDKDKLKEKERDFQFLNEEKVKELQEKKGFLMEELKQKLIEIDQNPEEEVFIENNNLRSINFDGENYFIYGKKGKKEEISLGEIMTASLWGKNLKLLENVPRKIKKEFLIREYKKRIFNLWNYQLREGLDSLPQTTYVDGADSILEKNEMNIESLPSGFAAEKMISSFLTRLSYDFPELPFELEEATVFDDVYQKIDFKIKIKKEYIRTVSIESCNKEIEECHFSSEIGIQYTLNEAKKEKKERQISKVLKSNEKKGDLVLVILPFEGIRKSIEEWKQNQTKTSLVGPENFLPLETRRKIFIAILDKLPENLKINAENYWNLIKNKID